MEKEAESEGIPIVEEHEGVLLYLLVKLARAKRVLELGTRHGIQRHLAARAVRRAALLTTYEMDPDARAAGAGELLRGGFGKQALVLEENAKDGLEKLEGRFDACFIDLLNSFRSEDITRRVVELCLERLDAGALLMADNALRQGEVVHPDNQQAKNCRVLQQLCVDAPSPGERGHPDPGRPVRRPRPD
jgi:predicted O-methyltransferase YrrM